MEFDQNNAVGTTTTPVSTLSSEEVHSISCLEFSPPSLKKTFLMAGTLEGNILVCQIDETTVQGTSGAIQTIPGPILDICWNSDGTKVYTASGNKTVKCWDLASNQTLQLGNHDAAVKSCHFIHSNNYQCVVTSSWDKSLKFWDARTPKPMVTLTLPERSFCADVKYPLAVVGTASRDLIIYQLQGTPTEYTRIESPLSLQHRCVALFREEKEPGEFEYGFAMGSDEGKVAIQYIISSNPKDNYTFKCHRSNGVTGSQDIYPVNDIKFHPIHGTFATVGSDGKFSFWDKDARANLKASESIEHPMSCCAFTSDGKIFAGAIGQDYLKAQDHDENIQNSIFLHACMDEMKPHRKS